MNRRRTFGAAGLIGLAWMAFGCGGGSASGSSVVAREHTYRGTQAPGDVWSYTIDAESFSATNSTLHHDYAGSVESLPSGFKKLTMVSSTDPDVHAGDVSYSIEIPATALVVKPVDGSTIVACGLGDQPTGSSLSYNWIALPERDWTPTDSSSYGTASFTSSGTSFNGAITSYNADDTLHKQFTDGFTYVAGSLTQPDDTDLNGAITPSGTFMLDFGPQRGGAIGVRRPTANLDPNEITARTFIGTTASGRNSNCVQAVGDGHGTFAAADFTNVETGAVSVDPEHTCTVTLGAQIEPGMFKATMTTSGGTSPMILVANKAGGKWVLYAFGTDDGAYNVMLVEK